MFEGLFVFGDFVEGVYLFIVLELDCKDVMVIVDYFFGV